MVDFIAKINAIPDKVFGWVKSCVGNFKDQIPLSKESLFFKASPRVDPTIQSVLKDFEKLDFEDSKCFNKIADDYNKKGKGDLFNNVILKERKEIIKILDSKLPLEKQEGFRKEYGQFILQFDKEINYGKELQESLRFLKDRAEEVLSDFKKLNFKIGGNKCKDPSDSVNYNNGWPADPFDKIANYYREKKISSFLTM